MSVKYIDDKGEFIQEGLAESGAPYRYGIKELKELVMTSLPAKDAPPSRL